MKVKFYSIKNYLVTGLLLLGIGNMSFAQVINLTVEDYFTGNSYTQSGNPIKYTFTIHNDLSAAFSNVGMSSAIPIGTTYYEGSTELNGIALADVNGTSPVDVQNDFILPLPNGAGVLQPGETATLTFIVIVNANAGAIRTFYTGVSLNFNPTQSWRTGFSQVIIPLIDDFSCEAAYITNGGTPSANVTTTAPNAFISAVNITDGTRINQIFSGTSTNNYYANTNTKMPLGSQLLVDASAIAFDKETQRIYFVNNSTTAQQELYYVSVATSPAKAYKFSSTTPYYFPVTPGVGKNITRMTWTPFGVGYALTDDAQHLIRFSVTNNVPTFTDLGPIPDLEPSASNPIANETGGDICADYYGNLFLITNSGKLYTIMMDEGLPAADYAGIPSGLPTDKNQSLTIGPDGRMVVSGAYQNAYKIDMGGMTATSITNGSTSVFTSGDYASCYYSQMPWFRRAVTAEKPNTQDAIMKTPVLVSPNPFVSSLNLKVALPAAETVRIRLIDMFGRTVYTTTEKLNSGINTLNLNVPGTLGRGIYILDLWSGNKRIMQKKLSHL